jgi:hypothetical protein
VSKIVAMNPFIHVECG